MVHRPSTGANKEEIAKKTAVSRALHESRTSAPKDRVVIFDFDGTIADVIPLMRQIYDQMAARRGLPQITDEKFKELQKSSLKDAIKWIGLKPWQMPGAMNEGRKLFYKKRKEVELFVGIKEVITQLHNDDCPIYILSSNSAETIKSVLRREGLSDYVIVLKRPPLFGKAGSIKKLIKQNRYSAKEVFMVGDEVRDIDAANKAGVQGVAVTWGLQHESVLRHAKPHYIAKKTSDLEKIFSK